MGIIKAFNDLFKSKGKGNILAVEQTANGENELLVINPSNRFEPIKSIVLELSKEEIAELCINNALEKLQLLKPETASFFHNILSTMTQGDFSKVSGPAFRKDGTQLSSERKKQCKIRSNASFSEEAYSFLTEKGKEQPVIAIDSTFAQISKSYNNALYAIEKIKTAERRNLKKARFYYVDFKNSCPACDKLNNQDIDLNSPFFLRPKGCICEVSSVIVNCEYDIDYND